MPLLRALAVLLAFQLAGELISRLTGLPIPGPVTGLILFALCLVAAARLTGTRPVLADPAADGILGSLGLLFVPAGVGVFQQLPVLGAHWLQIVIILIVTTLLTMVMTVYVFLGVSRLMDGRNG